MTQPQYHSDSTIRIDHSPQSNSDPTQENTVGATTAATRTIDYTPSDVNSVYVASTGETFSYSSSLSITEQARSIDLITGDIVEDGGDFWEFLAADEIEVDLTGETYVEGVRWTERSLGVAADPISSIKDANDLIDATRNHIYIVDSSTYKTTPIILSSDCVGIYSAVEQAPIIEFSYKNTDSYNLKTLLADGISFNRAGMCRLPSGDIFCIYQIGGTGTVCRTIDKDSLVANNDLQTVIATNYVEYSCSLTSNGDIFVTALSNGLDIYYFVIDKDDYTSLTKAATLLAGGTYATLDCITADDGTLISIYEEWLGGSIYYATVNGSTYAPVVANTLLQSSRRNPTISRLHNGNFLIGSIDGTNDVVYRTYDQTLTPIGSETSFGLPETVSEHCIEILSSGYILLLFNYDATDPNNSNSFRCRTYDESLNHLSSMSDIDLPVNKGGFLRTVNCDDIILGTIVNTEPTTDYDLDYNSFGSFSYLFETNSICKVDGMFLSVDTVQGRDGLFSQNEDLTIKHCTVQNIPKISGVDEIVLLTNTSDYDNVITNCKFLDCYLQTILTTNNADIQQNVFFNIVNHPCIEIDGNGASIVLDHNTFFNCYGGILLTNNDGNEIIKNSIFHENIVYDVKCGTTLIITYCDSTGTLTTCTADTNTIFIDPRFKNLGIDYTSNLDLNLKSEALGDDYTSPCIDNASDSKDMGAYDRSIVYSADTYSTIYIQKPDTIDIQYNAVNNSRNTNLDGTVRTYKDGAIKELSLKWSGVLNEDFEELLDFWFAHAGKVKVYLDPVTKPNEYEVYYLDFKNINGSPKKSPLLSETGVSDVEIILVKAYKG